jgi:porphobilinogen synthase
MRRLRANPALRDAIAEVQPQARQLVQPHFVVPGRGVRQDIEALPGIQRLSVDLLVEEVPRDVELGLRLHLLFGLPDGKDPQGISAADEEGPVPTALRHLREAVGPDVELWADVCLCAYTSHGHCGVLQGQTIDNDATLPVLAQVAVEYARAGASFVAPSDMMDGRVRAIRQGLDQAALQHIGILSYAAKMASAYYGPFREAADSTPAFGDRRSYQMDYRNPREALREVQLDLEEGADMVMVKPAMAYLDVLWRVRKLTGVPLAAYNVSGEYSMVKAAAERGWIDEGAVVRENLTALTRAGADLLITYHGRDALQQGWIDR